MFIYEVCKGAKIRKRYQWECENSQLDDTNESQEGSRFPTGDYKAHTNRRAKRHSNQKTEKIKNKNLRKKYRLGNLQSNIHVLF